MIRTLLTLLAGVAMTLAAMTYAAAQPAAAPAKAVGDLDAASCVEDEVPIRYPEGIVICAHIEGDGWRVG